MSSIRPRKSLGDGTRVHSRFRLTVILLFGLVGAWIFGASAAPVLNALSAGVIRMVSPKTIDLNQPAPTVRSTKPANHNGARPPEPSATSKPHKALNIAAQAGNGAAPPTYAPDFRNVLPFALLGAILGGFVGTLFLNGVEWLGARWDKMELGDRVNVFIGAFAGIFAALQFYTLFQNLDVGPAIRGSVLVVLMVGFGALTIYALQSMSEVLPWTKMRGRARRTGLKLMDTNVIIDGRIYDIAKTGFLDGQLYVPGFVLEELQYIADSHDQLRRQRGRRGLEVLKHMQAEFPLETHIHDRLAPDLQDGVDGRLVRLAKAIGADILTNDFNLKRVAELQDLRVLSLNDLALALRPNVLPQETLNALKIIKEGNQFGQGVGYLEDGTMVVVENGQSHIGETLDVTVTQVIQTERGKMIFAELSADEGAAVESRGYRRRRSG